ncbi:hypothetical protein Ddye_021391 [Dipteronia dyeriana]|uniref:DUF659 domain-containing protein n=1 Tax=Dipteronia dyeriana TaxID=168575 RepID=A0AAD9U1K5_9ROSI|nr:hypothetical protein Ddye_021391 [Dipteronia dyeriana]
MQSVWKNIFRGVYRLKEHIGHIKGNVASCSKSTKENIDLCRKAIDDAKHKRRNKRKEEDEIRAEVNISAEMNYVLKGIQQVGAHNVLQVVTDNASNNIAAVNLLKEKMPHVFWSSCATHTINLIFKSIGKLPKYKKFIDSTKAFKIFVYAHHKTLSLMRSFTKRRDIVRLGVTRFASAFLSLESLVGKNDGLRQIFTSTEWEKCKWANIVKGREAYSTMLSLGFWNGVNFCLKIHTKKMNRLDVDRLNNLVYIKFNVELMNIHKRLRDKEKKFEVLEASDVSNAYEWIVDEDDEEVELDLETDDDMDEEIEVQFKSDEEFADILREGDLD